MPNEIIHIIPWVISLLLNGWLLVWCYHYRKLYIDISTRYAQRIAYLNEENNELMRELEKTNA